MNDLQPWFHQDLDVGTVEVEVHGFLSVLFGLLRQWAVTWNSRVHLTHNAPFIISETAIGPRGATETSREAQGNALWLISHECLHVQQQREMGRGRFLLEYAAQWLRYRGGTGNKFEGPAYALGDRVYQAFKREEEQEEIGS